MGTCLLNISTPSVELVLLHFQVIVEAFIPDVKTKPPTFQSMIDRCLTNGPWHIFTLYFIYARLVCPVSL